MKDQGVRDRRYLPLKAVPELIGSTLPLHSSLEACKTYLKQLRHMPNTNRMSMQNSNQLLQLQGEVHALKGMLAVLISHVAVLSRAPLTTRSEILNSMNSMLPGALAKIEQDASADEAAGFERTIEVVTNLARDAVRLEPAVSSRQGNANR